MDKLDVSFDESDFVDLNTITTNFPDDLTGPGVIAKKLSDAFDGCVKTDAHMKVYLRIRPVSSNGKTTAESTINIQSDTSIVTSAPDTSKRAQYTKLEERHYTFNRVFGPLSLQSEVFDNVVAPLAERFIEGENCILLAYGMTNAGKTFTIQGSNLTPGILPRLIDAVLSRIATAETGNELQISMLEVYQEKLNDLLTDKKEKLTIRDGSGKMEVSKLTNHSISNPQEGVKLLDVAAARRSKSTTLLNAGSSRSHAVYSLTLQRNNGTSSVFQIVDLAGAERGNRTRATTAQQKEANNINVSLMQLWRCLQGLKRKTADSNGLDLIPYRESKLTHLLMPQLGRSGLQGVAMITCVNPQVDDYDETISVLSNASLACKIKEIIEIKPAEPSKPELRRNGSVTFLGNSHKDVNGHKSSIGMNNNNNGKRKRAGSTLTTSSSLTSQEMATLEVRTLRIPSEDLTEHEGPEYQADGVLRKSSESNLSVTVLSDEEGRELKRLRIEITQLREENSQLQKGQLHREAEIRAEVCEEMTVRSAHLLEQIHSLQEQLNEIDDQKASTSNVTRSVKKVRRRQIDVANEEAASDLRGAEEELESLKTRHELETNELRQKIQAIEKELAVFRRQEIRSSTSLSLRSSLVTGANVSSSSDALENTTGGNTCQRMSTDIAAAEFSQRMQRNQRLKKPEDENKHPPAVFPTKSICNNSNNNSNNKAKKLSTNRSPLSSIKVDGNSPVVVVQIAQDAKVGNKRSISPMANGKRISQAKRPAEKDAACENSFPQLEKSFAQRNLSSSNNEATGYFKKLRSQLLRA